MRDVKIIVPADPSKVDWTMDIDIIDGYPVYVDYERNTQDQRAALSTYTIKGTIPGMPTEGIEWDLLYGQNATVLDIDNAIRQNIQKNAGIPGGATQTYIPVYTRDEKGIHAAVYQAS